jgi:hypothetical protein
MEAAVGIKKFVYWASVYDKTRYVVFLAIIGLLFWQLTRLMTPAATMITTEHEIYLPQNYEVVAGVTNKFVENVSLGGAGGIAMLQIERSMDEYKKSDNGQNNFIVIDKTKNNSDQHHLAIDYYGKNPTSTHVFHTQHFIKSPAANLWGLYEPESFKILNDKLIVQREFHFYVIVAAVIIMLGFVSLFIIYQLSEWLGKYLYRRYWNS